MLKLTINVLSFMRWDMHVIKMIVIILDIVWKEKAWKRIVALLEVIGW